MNTLQKLIFRHFVLKTVAMPSHSLKNSLQASTQQTAFWKSSIFPLF